MVENKAALREAMKEANAVSNEDLSSWLWSQAREAEEVKTTAMLFEAAARLEPQDDQ